MPTSLAAGGWGAMGKVLCVAGFMASDGQGGVKIHFPCSGGEWVVVVVLHSQ